MLLASLISACGSGSGDGSAPQPAYVEPARLVGSWVFRGYECGSRNVYVDPAYAWSFVFDGTSATFTWDYAEGCRHVVSDVSLSDSDSLQYFGYGSSSAIVCTPAACDATYAYREEGSTTSIPTHTACDQGTHGSARIHSLTQNDSLLQLQQWQEETLFGECRAAFDRTQ